jgi:hypothetical protein
MMTFVRGLVIGAVLAGASVALAGPASAEPLSGPYSGILIDGAGTVLNPKPINLSFAPCGPDCTKLTTPQKTFDLHLQGDTWVANYDWNGSPCTVSVDLPGTVLDDRCPNEQPMRMSLTKT